MGAIITHRTLFLRFPRRQLLSEWFRAINSFVLYKFDKSFTKSLKSCSKSSWGGVNWTLISIALSLTCTDPGLLTSHKNNLQQKRSSKVTLASRRITTFHGSDYNSPYAFLKVSPSYHRRHCTPFCCDAF